MRGGRLNPDKNTRQGSVDARTRRNESEEGGRGDDGIREAREGGKQTRCVHGARREGWGGGNGYGGSKKGAAEQGKLSF